LERHAASNSRHLPFASDLLDREIRSNSIVVTPSDKNVSTLILLVSVL